MRCGGGGGGVRALAVTAHPVRIAPAGSGRARSPGMTPRPLRPLVACVRGSGGAQSAKSSDGHIHNPFLQSLSLDQWSELKIAQMCRAGTRDGGQRPAWRGAIRISRRHSLSCSHEALGKKHAHGRVTGPEDRDERCTMHDEWRTLCVGKRREIVVDVKLHGRSRFQARSCW